ncbi:eukaryotic translation initiation factor 2A-like [Stegodyphus dumicola]|uniref:eukaryotic translation initiation factor 2A-like n=1 Tax=Stegodyphus dumicola TaxID=202533 RepID=UPI0015B07144|nr:eukaryotic translation initiation factor 2A-like [Stegodyphus dumicola]
MSAPDSVIALRSSRGIKFCHGPPLEGEYNKFTKDENSSCRDMTFTKDGSLFAWCTIQRTNIMDGTTYESLCQLNNSRVSLLQFSPKGTYLSTWEPYSAKQNAQESCNLHIWDIKGGSCVKSFIQKKQVGW